MIVENQRGELTLFAIKGEEIVGTGVDSELIT